MHEKSETISVNYSILFRRFFRRGKGGLETKNYISIQKAIEKGFFNVNPS